ncbi:MAG: hypothetical protein ACJA2Q_002177 [Pseudohongiellaceae bacterium]|jgi:hypothetical protein
MSYSATSIHGKKKRAGQSKKKHASIEESIFFIPL